MKNLASGDSPISAFNMVLAKESFYYKILRLRTWKQKLLFVKRDLHQRTSISSLSPIVLKTSLRNAG